jgi:hypothetical protein
MRTPRNLKLINKIKNSGVAPKGTSMGKNTKENSEYDNEGGMAKGQLKTIADAALELHDMLKDDTNMPEWVQSKITKATDYIDTARDYMKNELPTESVKEDAPAMSMSGGHVASHDAFPLGNPNHDKMIRRNMKPIDVEDKRYKKKKRQGETVVLKRFKGYMKGQ